MPTLAAIDLDSDHATLVTAVTEGDGLLITSVERIEIIPEPNEIGEGEDSSDSDQALSDSTPDTEPSDNGNGYHPVRQDFDVSLAMLKGDDVLFSNLALPFRDQKTLDRIVPLQLQDSLPFEVDDFIVDTVVVGKGEEDTYYLLSSIVPENTVRRSLAQLKTIGADPRVLTTPSSALTAVRRLLPNTLQGSFVLALFRENTCSLAIFVDNKLGLLRELSYRDAEEIVHQIKCSIQKVEAGGASIEACYVLGRFPRVEQLFQGLGRPISVLKLEEFAHLSGDITSSIEDLAWAISLFADEIRRDRSELSLVNFRQGAFAFRPMFAELVSVAKQYWVYFALFVVCFILWLATSFYATEKKLAQVEEGISQVMTTQFPDEIVPYGGESRFIVERIDALEEDLRNLGSLSSLSPLDSLLEISQAINPSINIEIDKMFLRDDGISFSGSVENYSDIGRIQSALEAKGDTFCRVEVKSQGQRRDRKGFEAELALCQ